MPTATTYDYDALLTEAGDLTEKYHAVKKVNEKYFGVNDTIKVKNTDKKAYGKVELVEQAELFASLHNLSNPVECAHTLTMEKLGQNYGFVLYRTKVTGPKGEVTINIKDCRDRALIYLDGQYQGVIDTTEEELNVVKINIDKKEAIFDILVENLGRVNYGKQLGECKGITDGVMLDYQYQYDWTMYPIPVNDLTALEFEEVKEQKTPCFYKGCLTVDKIADTFILMDGWKKGVVYINGFNLGRYWEKGPQKTLYVPAPILKEGKNEIVIFELEGCQSPVVEFIDTPQFM